MGLFSETQEEALKIQEMELEENYRQIYREALLGRIHLTHALCFILGWQGGTVHQVAAELGVNICEILNADHEQAGDLCRKAQQVKRVNDIDARTKLLFKHLGVCVRALKEDYAGHDTPSWLERAEGVFNVMAESIVEA